MSADGQGRNIAGNLNRLGRVGRTNVTDDRRQTDGWAIAYSEREAYIEQKDQLYVTRMMLVTEREQSYPWVHFV